MGNTKRYGVRTKPLARRTLRVSVKRGLPILVGRDHHLLSPFFQACVDSMARPRGLLLASTPGKVQIDDSAIFKLKQSIIRAGGVCKSSQFRAVQRMPRREFCLGFADEGH